MMIINIEIHPSTADTYEPIPIRLNLARILAGVRRYQNLILLFVLAALWGSSSVTTKLGVAAIPPFTFAFARLTIGALILSGILWWRGQRLPQFGSLWLHLAVGALLHGAGPYLLLAWGLQFVDSSMASVLGGIAPMVTMILAHFLIAGDRLTAPKIVGVLIGFAGLVVLVAPALQADVHFSSTGLLAVGAASLFFGSAYTYTARFIRGRNGLALSAAQLLLASVMILPVVVVLENPFAQAAPPPAALQALLVTGVLGTGLPFLLYQHLKDRLAPSQLSLVSYIIPAVGVTLGVLILGETVTWGLFAGGGIILLGMMVANGVFDRWGLVPRPKIPMGPRQTCPQPC